MPKPERFSAKREQLEMLAVISVRLDNASRAKIDDGDVQAAMLLMEAIDMWIADSLRRVVEKCCHMLSEWDGWTTLAVTPKEFNLELDRYSNGAKTAMKLLYDVPDFRPRSLVDNPRRVAELKKAFPTASWGQLSVKFENKYGEKLSANAVERAYMRFVGRIQQVVMRAHRLMQRFKEQKALSESELADKLPTPEYVLDILTGNTALQIT